MTRQESNQDAATHFAKQLMLQRLAFDTAMTFLSQDPQIEKRFCAKDVMALANLTRSSDVVEDRKRILRGRPLLGPLKPEKAKPPRKPFSTTPSETPDG